MGSCASAPLEDNHLNTSNVSKGLPGHANAGSSILNNDIEEMDELMEWNDPESVLNLAYLEMTEPEKENIRLKQQIVQMQQQLNNKLKFESRVSWQYRDEYRNNELGLWINYDHEITKQIEQLNIGEKISFEGEDSFCRESIDKATHKSY